MKVIFIMKNNEERVVDCAEGQTLLEVAENNSIPLHGSCEGQGICGLCHVIVENLNEKLPAISDLENNALDNVFGVTMKSRLACRIILSKDLDGLRVRLI